MKLTLFGATGDLGQQCLQQSLDAGHEVTALVRDPAKLSQGLADKVQVVAGDALVANDIKRVIASDTDAILFAIGVDKHSPQNLCTDATRLIFERMREVAVKRFVWCGGGSTLVAQDQVTFGARMVARIAALFMALRHFDKEHQYAYLLDNQDIEWFGVRPLQMRKGPRRGQYRLGFDTFSGMSKIHFADCADAMVGMLEDDTWLHQAPIIQY